MAKNQLDLFAKPRLSKRKLRHIRRAWERAVDDWASGVVMLDLRNAYIEAGRLTEAQVIMIDGSGPPSSLRRDLLLELSCDLADAGRSNLFVEGASNRTIVKTAIRLGTLPKSIVSTMPPKPVELASAP